MGEDAYLEQEFTATGYFDMRNFFLPIESDLDLTISSTNNLPPSPSFDEAVHFC
jgi:hypothetical protein